MEVLAECGDLQLCPCYKESQEFQKLVELKDYGLVVYCHRTCTENIKQDEAVESAVNTSSDVFILHNKKGVKVSTSQLKSELEKENISCPRCRKRFQHAQELMKEVKSLDRRIVMGICDHCRKRVQFSKKTFCACEEIVKLFKTVKGEQTEDTKKYVKVLPSKTGHLRKDKQKEIRAYSDLQINRDIKSPAAGHEPEVQQMFYSDTHFQSDDTETSETDSKKGYIKQAVGFIEPSKPMETSFVSTPHKGEKINTTIPGISLVGSVNTFVDSQVGVKELPRPSIKDRNQKEIFEDIPSMNAKEELKRRHDLSLRQMVKLEKTSGVPISISKRPDVYENPKIAPWEQKQPTPKYHVESETEIKKIPIRTKHDLGPSGSDYVSNRLSKFGSPRKKKNLQDFDIEPSKLVKEQHEKKSKGLLGSDERVKNVKDPYFVTNVKLGRNVGKVKKPEQRVTKSKSKPMASVGSVVNPQFSYFFPKVKEKKVKHITVRSSELIKDTHERYKKRKEQKREQNQGQGQKKQLGQEDIKLQKVEKMIYMDEQQMLSQRDKSQEIIFGKEVAKKDKKSKPEQKVKDAVEEKSRFEEKVEGAVKEGQLKTKVQKEKLNTEEEEKLEETVKGEKIKSKKGERDGKLQRDKQVGKEILKQVEKLHNKKLQTGNDLKEEKRMKEKVASAKTRKSIKKKLKSSDDIKMSASNIDESVSEENEVEEKVSIKKKKKGKIATEKESPKLRKEREEFKRLQAEHLKAKAEALKKKLELDAQKAKQEAERKELKMKKKLMKQGRSSDFLKLVKIKQTRKITPRDINNELLKAHTAHYKRGQKLSTCPLCLDSELELEVLSLNKEIKKDKINNIIIGEKIYKHKPGHEKTKKSEGVVPIFFQKDVLLESDFQERVQIIPQEAEAVQKKILATSVSKKDEKEIDMEFGTGITRYALSDRTFIDKGWTVLPTEKVVRMMNVYRMHPARPEFDWFKHNRNKRLMTYDTGERLAEFDDNGRGRWYYRSGRLALDYYDAEEINAQQRFVVYSSGEPDERGRTHPITILATFDYLGNGIVFDHAGKIRLKYNQTEGVVLDRAIGPVSHWKWHTLNDPPVLQQVMIDTQVQHKDPDILKLGSSVDVTTRPDNEEMLAIEFDNFIKEKSKKLSQKLVPFQIKMKALKINEHFSLKVLDQATVYLIFRDGLTNLKVNMGMILDEKEIVDTETAEVGEVSNSLERFPARTDSLAGLQRSVAYARRYERQHAERERWLRPPEPCASADLMTAAASMPIRLPLRTMPTGSSSTTRYCSRKPSNNLYYDTRLLC